jgi:hypothetical protein
MLERIPRQRPPRARSRRERKVAAEEKLRNHDKALWLAALNPEVLAMVKQSGLADRLGRERMLFNLEVAVERYARMNSTSEVASIDSGGVQN